MPTRPPPLVSDCPGSSSAPRQDVDRSRARSPHRGEAAISVAIVACSVPASPASRSPRRPSTGQECRSCRTAGSKRESRDWLRWPASSRNGGRDQIGTVADIKSESPAGLRRNSHSVPVTRSPERGFPGRYGANTAWCPSLPSALRERPKPTPSVCSVRFRTRRAS